MTRVVKPIRYRVCVTRWVTLTACRKTPLAFTEVTSSVPFLYLESAPFVTYVYGFECEDTTLLDVIVFTRVLHSHTRFSVTRFAGLALSKRAFDGVKAAGGSDPVA